MNKKTITSYEGLRRWAEKRIGDSYNLWIMDKALRDINEAFHKYVQMGCKSIEVEE